MIPSEREMRVRWLERRLPRRRELQQLEDRTRRLQRAIASVRQGPNGPSGPCGTVTVHVTGCNGVALAGVTVEFTQAGVSVIGPGTTDAAGNVTLDVPAAGTYTRILTPPAGGGYATHTSSQILTCSAQSSGQFIGLDADHVCCVGCATPLPRTLYLTGVVGTIPLVNTGGTWIGCGTFVTPGQVDSAGYCTDVDVTTPIRYTLECPTPIGFTADQKWRLSLTGVGALFGVGHHYGPGHCTPGFGADAGQCSGYGVVTLGGFFQDGDPQSSVCRPVDLGFTIASGNGNCQHCETVTITE